MSKMELELLPRRAADPVSSSLENGGALGIVANHGIASCLFIVLVEYVSLRPLGSGFFIPGKMVEPVGIEPTTSSLQS